MNEDGNTFAPRGQDFSSSNISPSDADTLENNGQQPISQQSIAPISSAADSSASRSRLGLFGKKYNTTNHAEKPVSFSQALFNKQNNIVTNNATKPAPNKKKIIIIISSIIAVLIVAALIVVFVIINNGNKPITKAQNSWRIIGNYILFGEEKNTPIPSDTVLNNTLLRKRQDKQYYEDVLNVIEKEKSSFDDDEAHKNDIVYIAELIESLKTFSMRLYPTITDIRREIVSSNYDMEKVNDYINNYYVYDKNNSIDVEMVNAILDIKRAEAKNELAAIKAGCVDMNTLMSISGCSINANVPDSSIMVKIYRRNLDIILSTIIESDLNENK